MTTCQACGLEAPPEARFCARCGARLGTPDGQSIPVESRQEVMSDLRGEERLVTVVFTDMRAAFDLEPATLTIRGIAELVEAFKAERAPPAQFDRMTRDHAAEPATQSEISRIQGPGSG